MGETCITHAAEDQNEKNIGQEPEHKIPLERFKRRFEMLLKRILKQ
jgi:hypothetical protein